MNQASASSAVSALSSGRPVALYTRTASARSVIAALVFHRAGVKIENVYERDLADEDFDRLANVLRGMKRASIRFEEGLPGTQDSMARIAAGGFVLLC